MVDILATPFLWVVATIALYAVAYWGYGKWIDRNVWRSDAKKATPAHMYMDGVEYFPVSRYVLWGYQFKSVAALGPILGPFIGVTFGWLPALIWIIGGNFFIGWLQDYGSMMLSVRKEGRSFGPITYEFTGARGGRTSSPSSCSISSSSRQRSSHSSLPSGTRSGARSSQPSAFSSPDSFVDSSCTVSR